jgi:Sec-independent protein translocase protein TatA
MKQDTSEKWIKEFRDNVNYDEAELGCNWDMNQLEDFIHKTRQEAKQETIKEIKEWAMEYKYARHNPDIYCDCETCMFVKNLLSKLNSI